MFAHCMKSHLLHILSVTQLHCVPSHASLWRELSERNVLCFFCNSYKISADTVWNLCCYHLAGRRNNFQFLWDHCIGKQFPGRMDRKHIHCVLQGPQTYSTVHDNNMLLFSQKMLSFPLPALPSPLMTNIKVLPSPSGALGIFQQRKHQKCCLQSWSPVETLHNKVSKNVFEPWPECKNNKQQKKHFHP